MIISDIAIRRSTSVLVLMFCIVLAGTYSYMTLPRESTPDIDIPIVTVSTSYRGVSAPDIETSVTMKLEKKLKGVKDLDEMHSTSAEGISNISLKFLPDTDIETALQRVRDKVDQAKGDLPSEAEEPMISEISLSEFPVMIVNIAGDVGLVRLKEVADDLEDELETIRGVLEVQVIGGREREILVEFNPDRMSAYGIPYANLVLKVQEENVNVSGGFLDLPEAQFQMRVPGEFVHPGEIDNIVVFEHNGRPIYLREVARIIDGHEDRKTMSRFDGRESITLVVQKRAGENIIKIVDQAKQSVQRYRERFAHISFVTRQPATAAPLSFTVTGDASKDIRIIVSDLENSVLSGLVLVLIILPFFIGLRNASFVAIAIPMSMLLTFAVLASQGITLNMVCLFSLVLAVGMLVDNAIVIVENSYRHMQEGLPRVEAARLGVAEVAWPVSTSTVTTLAAFFPLLFWPEAIGEFMWYLPMTVITALTASLFVGLVITPALCSLYMKVQGRADASGDEWFISRVKRYLRKRAIALCCIGVLLACVCSVVLMTFLSREQAMLLAYDSRFLIPSCIVAGWALLFSVSGLLLVLEHGGRAYGAVAAPIGRVILGGYESLLRGSLRYPLAALGIAVGGLLVIGSLYRAYGEGVEFLPETDPRRMTIDVKAPEGTSVDATDAITRIIEEKLRDRERYPDVEHVITNVGSRGVDFFGSSAAGTHIARINVDFVDREYRQENTRAQMERMRHDVADIPGAEITVEAEAVGPPTGRPVNIEIAGDDFEQLHPLAEKVKGVIRDVPGLTDLRDDYEASMPELRFEVDRERAALFGLTTNHVAYVIKTAIRGHKVSQYRTGNDEYDIRVRLQERFRKDIQRIQQLPVGDMSGRQIPLSSVATVHYSSGMGTIKRLDQKRVITVSGENLKGFRPEQVLEAVQKRLKNFPMPPGYQITFTGENEDQEKANAFLKKAFAAGVLLIACILVAQFDSFFLPLIIMTSVVLSLAGVLIGLLVTETPFGVIMTGMGVISLVGIVVNNAIVLLDYTQLLRRGGLPLREAVVRAGRTRLRPVFLTAVTTVFGLMPMALAISYNFRKLRWDRDTESSQWWGPMAIAVIFGLAAATFLTLIVVPCLYYFTCRLSDGVRKFAGLPPKALPPVPDHLKGALPRDIMERSGSSS